MTFVIIISIRDSIVIFVLGLEVDVKFESGYYEKE